MPTLPAAQDTTVLGTLLALLPGAALALLVAGGAWRAGSLSPSGFVAAAVVGTAAVGAGWRWAFLLLAFFVPATLLSRWRADRKSARTAAVVEKGSARDAAQVLANGGVFLLAAIGTLLLPHAAPWWTIAAGALAAATSDTWATEIGTAIGGTPRSVLDGRQVQPGESGGITAAGTLGGAAGALFAGMTAAALASHPSGAPYPLGATAAIAATAAVAAGGLLGMLADSLLGATQQQRRRCPACGAGTERRVHSCGTRTVHAGGLRWLDNDAVNLAATIAGAGAAAMFASWFFPTRAV